MYVVVGANSSSMDWKKSIFKLPVGRVNCISPLGHSGHPKLHAVVGSKAIAKGFPQGRCIFVNLEK